MSLQDYKISEDTVQQVYVQAQQDILTGTAQQNKAVFDALPLLIKDRLNAVLDALSGSGAAAQVPIQTVDGLTAGNVQQAIEQIKAMFDAYEAKIQSSAGAAAVGVSAIDGVSGSTVQQALQSIKGLIDTIQAGTLPDGAVTSDLIADGAVTAQKIADDAIVQLGALLAVAAAAAYDPEGSYAVDDYCTNGGKLYKCGTPIPDGEEWNAEHWIVTTVMSEIANKADKVSPEKIPLHLVSGVSKLNAASIYKTQEGSVLINAWVKFDNPVSENTETQVAIAAEQLRPIETIGTTAIVDSGGDKNLSFARVSIDSDGIIRILSPSSFSFAVFSIAYSTNN